ncbi:MAG: fumarylacetoacetate hydrolase family protein [Phycisphaerales bacterium]|nr:fumarylacetoacetate hydrolase family protein [Phycisphaerales bacterium]
MTTRNDTAIKAAAARLHRAQETLTPCQPVRDLIPADDLETAYAVQQCNIDHDCQQGRRLIGSKIALSSKAIQEKLKVRYPTYGRLFADMCLAEGVEIDFGTLIQPRIETEVALVIAKTLDHERHTIIDMIGAVVYAVPAFEIVGCRIANWDVSAADFIADNSASSYVVLGSRPRMLSEFDIVRCQMRTTRRGEVISSGSGASCYGNPLHALIWLADALAKADQPLQPGDLVMSGSLGPMVPIEAGDVIEAHIDGLGPIRARFTTG